MELNITHHDVNARLAPKLAREIVSSMVFVQGEPNYCYAVPRGGVAAAYAVMATGIVPYMEIVDEPERAHFMIDDIIDTGSTMETYCDEFPGMPFYALIDKREENENRWITFPWERGGNVDEGIENNVNRILQYIGEDPTRGGLLETPARVSKAWRDWTAGYGVEPEKLLKVFEDGADKCDEMVMVKDIPFYSHCEHHMAPFFGTATVAYIPNGKIVGLSKINRLVNAYARRLQVQERLTNQIADAIDTHLGAKGVGVVIKARHMCMESRGVCQQGHHTLTSAVRGVIKTAPEARAEFMSLARS